MRVWTVAEADAALPSVRERLERVRALLASFRKPPAPSNGHRDRAAGGGDLSALLAELEREGIVVRDADRGLVDFAAETAGGRRYWLCWLASEDAVVWWHWPEEGFAGRRPIAEAPR